MSLVLLTQTRGNFLKPCPSEEAIAIYEKVFRMHPYLLQLYRLMSCGLEETGKLDEAYKMMQKAHDESKKVFRGDLLRLATT